MASPLALTVASPEFKSLITLVNSQLACLRPVGILNPVKFNLNYLFQIFLSMHAPLALLPRLNNGIIIILLLCTGPLGTRSFRNFKPEVLLNGKLPGTQLKESRIVLATMEQGIQVPLTRNPKSIICTLIRNVKICS